MSSLNIDKTKLGAGELILLRGELQAELKSINQLIEASAPQDNISSTIRSILIKLAPQIEKIKKLNKENQDKVHKVTVELNCKVRFWPTQIGVDVSFYETRGNNDLNLDNLKKIPEELRQAIGEYNDIFNGIRVCISSYLKTFNITDNDDVTDIFNEIYDAIRHIVKLNKSIYIDYPPEEVR